LEKITSEAAKENSMFSLDDRLGLIHDTFALGFAGFAKVSSALTAVQNFRDEKECKVYSPSCGLELMVRARSCVARY
jgi:aminopeptidase 2